MIFGKMFWNHGSMLLQNLWTLCMPIIQRSLSFLYGIKQELKLIKKSIFIKSWYEKGVKIVDDFLDEKGFFLSKENFAKKFKY